MAISLPAPLKNFGQKLAANPMLMQRLLLVGVLWGAVSFGWGSITENALTNRLPTLFDHATRSAAEVSDYLARSADILTPLTEDPRLIVGLSSDEGTSSPQVTRAMYEFSYLNKLNKLWIYSGLTDATVSLAASGPLPDDIQLWLKSIPSGSNGSNIAIRADDERGASPYAYYVAKPIPGSNGGLVIARLSWQNLLKNWPDRAPISGFDKAQQGILGTGGKSLLWLPLGNPSEAAEQPWFSATAKQTDYAKDTIGNVWVWATVPNQSGWRVAIRTPIGNALGEGGVLRWLLVLGTLAATIAILWLPTKPFRKKLADRTSVYTGPIAALGKQAFGPAFSAAKTMRKSMQKERGQPLASPGQFDADDFKSGKRKPAKSGAPTMVTARRAHQVETPSPTSKPIMLAPKKPDFQPDMTPTVNQLLGHKEDPQPPARNEKDFSPTMEEMVDQAILQRRVKLLYQPIYETGTGLPVYHEVLARLMDPQGNLITPQVFIPILQKNRWMPRLDALVFGKILTQYDAKTGPETPLTVNISGATIDNIRYISKVQELKGLPVLKNLMFELSSQELLADPGVIKLLMSTKSSGIKLAVDYFGGGNMMLESSKKLGFDYVKINTMKFSENDAGKKDLIVLCRTAQRIGLPVVLEKIETVAMEIFARKLGVAYLQGYQLSKPLDALTTAALPSWSANSSLERSEELPTPTS